MNKLKKPVFICAIGKQRSGKTTLIKKTFIGSSFPILVYNAGDVDDFPDFVFIEPITKGKNIYFTNGKIVFKKSDLGAFIHSKKKVAMHRIFNRSLERSFLSAVFNYYGYGNLFIDDTRPLLRYGISDEFLQIFARQAHCGAKGKIGNGLNVSVVFHGYNEPPISLYSYVTHLFLFYTVSPPEISDFKRDKTLYERLRSCYITLNSSRRYSYFVMDMVNYEPILVEP